LKIVTQFDDSCSRCSQFILKKSTAYRDKTHDLVCTYCYEGGVHKKTIKPSKTIDFKKEITTSKPRNSKKVKITAPINLVESDDHSEWYDQKLNSRSPDDWLEAAQRVKEQENESKYEPVPIKKKPQRKTPITKRTNTASVSKPSVHHTSKSKLTVNNTLKHEFTELDTYKIKDKIKKQNFDTINDLTNTLSAYNISNSQNTRDLTIQKSLESTIQILDHQIMCAKKVKNELNGRVILADEVGLGKTIEAGILLKEYFTTGMIKNALILTPPSLRTQWQEELKSKFDLDFIVNKDDARFMGLDRHDMQIISLASASQEKNAELLKNTEWDIVIVDEAHRLKNSKTRAHVFVKELNKKFVFLLSATPIQNSILELYNMIEIVKPGLLGTWKNFSAKYIVDKKARVINSDSKSELQNLLQQVVVRTTRSEVRKYLEFTERIPKTHVMKPSKEESLLYEKTTDFVRDLWAIEKGKKNLMLPLMTMQRQISSSTESIKSALNKKITQFPDSSAKINELLKLCGDIQQDTKIKELKKIIDKNKNSKYLIFTEFRDTQKYIVNALEQDNLSVTKFNGSMSTKERDVAVKQFKNDINILVSTEAGGEGQNFQFCSNVINYDLPWNPMKVEQRVGRVHRIGQKEDVRIHNLAISGSIEEHILKLLFDKINLFKMTIGDLELLFEEEGLKNISKDVFESYMSSKSNKEIKNKFSALGDKWKGEKKKINDTIMEFDEQVFTHFNLSSMEE
jgi:SNF2 family DNA or RNA helicase